MHGEPRDEFKKRESGQVVVSDLRDTKDEKDENELHAGDQVAVIDCMTFVPEHVPVLKALEELQLSPLPFKDGIIFICVHLFAKLRNVHIIELIKKKNNIFF